MIEAEHPMPGVTRKLVDGRGLDLLIDANGRKWWRFKYHVGRHEKCLLLGNYPAVWLEEARARADSTRRLFAAGIDPGKQPVEVLE